MISTILRAKHWQLFILIFGLPFLVYLYMVYQIFSTFSHLETREPDPTIIFGSIKYLMGFAFISMIVYWTWYWSVGVGLRHKIPAEIKTSPNLFKAFLLFPAVYLVVVSLFALSLIGQVSTFEPGTEPTINPLIFTLIIPFHFFSIFCIFYCIYHVAKTIKTVELQRKVTFSDFVGEFFLVWFFPIGVWILQPTINKLAEKDDQDDFNEIL